MGCFFTPFGHLIVQWLPTHRYGGVLVEVTEKNEVDASHHLSVAFCRLESTVELVEEEATHHRYFVNDEEGAGTDTEF